jgi:hypothetical protein
MTLPRFLVLGAPKSGTTSLHAWFDAHPGVFVPTEKELFFFDRSFDDGIDTYAKWFAAARPDQVPGEVATTYLRHPEVPARVAATLPGARLIAVLREPASRAWSHYWFIQALWGVTEPFEQITARQMADPTDIDRTHVPYLDGGRYATHLERWESVTGRDSLLVLLSDDLRTDPLGCFRRVCEFIGADPGFVPPTIDELHNPTRRVRSPWVLRNMYRVRAWERSPKLSARVDRWNREGPPIPPMPAGLKAELMTWYRPEMERLEQWLGRPLPPSWIPNAF